MNRIVIFSFYNKEGEVSKYVLKLLDQLSVVSTRIIFVVNGTISRLSKKKIHRYTREIVKRKNIGLDYGAYCDIILNYLQRKEICLIDEIILMNDTFYGFIEPIESIIKVMDEKKNDIWGLARVDRGILSFLCTFFLVIGKRVLNDSCFFEFLSNNLVVDNNYSKVCAYFEHKLFDFFRYKGYKIGSYTTCENYNFLMFPYKCIVDFKLPVIKKKAVMLKENRQYIERIIDMLEKNKTDIGLGYDEIICTDVLPKPSRFFPKPLIKTSEMIDWANQGDFYIYGAGHVGQLLYYTYFEQNKYFCGFVANQKAKGIFLLNEIPDNARLILGIVREDIIRDVTEKIPKSMQVLYLWDYSNY